jgi:hypothetical protein
LIYGDSGNDPTGGDWPLGGGPNNPPSGGGNDPPGGDWPPGGDLKDPPPGGYNDLSSLPSDPVPEPGTLALLGATLFGLVFVRRKRCR